MKKVFTEIEIQEAADAYANRHSLDEVDISRQFEGDEGDDGLVIGFRLSPGDGTECAGIDERFGAWGS